MWFISAGLNRHYQAILKLDLWELPQPRHTNTITSDVERNFYSRCPSNKRPAFMHRLHSDTPLSGSELGKTESKSEEKVDKPGNIEPSNNTEQTGKKYDESLFKALHHTFFKRIWASAVLLVISGERKSSFRNVLVLCNISLRDRHAQNDHSSIKSGDSHLACRVICLFSPVGHRTNCDI